MTSERRSSLLGLAAGSPGNAFDAVARRFVVLPARWRAAATERACSREQRRRPARCIAALVPRSGHIKFVQATIAELERQGVLVHYFTEPDQVGHFKEVTRSDRVYPWVHCRQVPYRIILTPATHIPYERYKHPSSQIVHVPHSMVSLHTIFTPETFLGFDHVFCCGPHHMREIQAIFRHNGRGGRAVGTGYEVIDRLARLAPVTRQGGERRCILVAPTWGKSSLLYRFGRELVDRLIRDHDVILRPHQWRMEEVAHVIDALRRDYAGHPGFRYDDTVDAKPSMDAADLMITDYSGVAFEFALGYLRPVVFMDGPRKNDHLEWRRILDVEGVEVRCRTTIGTIVQDIDRMQAAISDALKDGDRWSARLTKAREELLFNFGDCAGHAANEILRILGGLGAVDPEQPQGSWWPAGLRKFWNR